MADVLVPASPGSMTMLHSQDPYQNVPTQPLNGSRVVARGTRSSVYYGQPIPQYQFQSAPILRQDARAQNRHSLNHYVRTTDPDSSSSTASSASSSSNQSASFARSADDSIVGVKQRQSLNRDIRAPSNVAATRSTPDLTIIPPQDAVKPSLDRYRRLSRRLDNNSSSLPVEAPKIQRPSSSMGFTPSKDKLSAARPPAMRQASYDDSALASASRYKRRSLVGRTEPLVTPPPVTSPVNASVLTWSQVVAGRRNFQGPLPQPVAVDRDLRNFRPLSMNDLRSLQPTEPVFVSSLPLLTQHAQADYKLS
jgi:hypothetical protein